MIKEENFWIEYFDDCDRCGKSVGEGKEGYLIDENDEDTVHICDECYNELLNGKDWKIKNE